jgi:hypothetical protein
LKNVDKHGISCEEAESVLPKQKCLFLKMRATHEPRSVGVHSVDPNGAVRVSMPNLKFSTETIFLRMPVALLNNIRREANRNDIPYHRAFLK